MSENTSASLPPMARFTDAQGVEYSAPAQVFMLEEFDYEASGTLSLFYDEQIARRHLAVLQDEEYARFLAENAAAIVRTQEHLAALTPEDIAFLEVAEIAHQATGRDTRRSAREFLVAHGHNENLYDPREALTYLHGQAATPKADWLAANSRYGLSSCTLMDPVAQAGATPEGA